MAFLDPAEGNRYFGNQQFHLKLVKMTPADPGRGYVPAYHFEMVADGTVVGRCNLRVGQGENIQYAGNIGYEVEMGYRGRHYALRAARLLLRLAFRHRMQRVLITCRPDNLPSRKTCERLGAVLCGQVTVPAVHEMYRNGDRELLQYEVDLQDCILPALESDIPKIAQLYDDITEAEAAGQNFSGWEKGEYPEEWTARELYDRGGLHVVLDATGRKVIASAAYDNDHEPCYERVAWSRPIPSEQTLCVHTLAVHPDCRGRGLGEKLMRFGFAQASERHLAGVRIDTWVGNEPGLRLYHRLGYHDAGVLEQDVHYSGDRMAYQFLEWYGE